MKVIYRYYRKPSFAWIDLSLLFLYLFQNPFRLSKRFLKRREERDVDVYGETPLTTLARIAFFCQVQKEDLVFELGSGRGRGCFWLKSFIGCDVVGVEFVPQFVKKANKVQAWCHVKGIEFRQEDLLKTSFEGATFFYLYGTCYDTIFIKKLIEKLKMSPKGTKIVTVSYELNDYSDEKPFVLYKKLSLPFTWGEADVYLQVLKN